MQNKECAGAPCLVDSLRDYKVESVECGRNHTFAIVNDKLTNSLEDLEDDYDQHIFCWGSNEIGQLGLSLKGTVDLPVKLSFFEHQKVIVN